MRKMKYKLEILLPSDGRADREQMERLLELHFQDLVFDDEFIATLDEQQSVTIRISPFDLSEAGFGEQTG